MKALLSICLFWGLLSPGFISAQEPKSCFTCMGEDCARPSVQKCEAHKDACASGMIESTQISPLMPEYSVPFRQCAPAHICMNNYVSITTSHGGNGRMAVQCCYTDQCNNMTISLPKREKYPPNGVVCPSCFTFDSEECPEGETINCTGGETKCIEARLNVSIGFLGDEFVIHYRGCATPNACFVPFLDAQSSPKKMKVVLTKRECTDGDMNVQIGESEFSNFWAPPFLDEEKEVGGQGK